MADSISLYLVAAGKYHDIDFARLELLKLLAEHDNIRVTVADSYDDIEAITNSKVLMTYTCCVIPTLEEQQALQDWVKNGGKWFALHGTNSILVLLEEGVWDSPDTAPVLMQTLGTQFIAHPRVEPFTVKTADPGHELVKGVGEFETDDELYLSRIHGDIHPLLYANYNGSAPGWVENKWFSDEPRPIYYINRLDKGEVLYLNLGHCRGHYDMKPLMDYYPVIERGSWEKPEYYELLRRGIRYCCGISE